MQQPHPPIWVAASRSDDTYRWAGEQGVHVLTLPYMYEPEVLRNSIDCYREAGTFYFGGMPPDMALRNIRRFAAEVMPAFAQAEAMAP